MEKDDFQSDLPDLYFQLWESHPTHTLPYQTQP